MLSFSVLLAIYKNDNPRFLHEALQSLVEQTLVPNEVVIVIDGPIGQTLSSIVEQYQQQHTISWKLIALEENVGLGKALAIGLNHCSYDVVARMDSDDICYQDRFEKQLQFLQSNPPICAVGTYITEFIAQPNDINKIKVVPATHAQIIAFSKLRNPMNHPTVMFRKSAVVDAGGYMHMPLFEDYFLWMRMIHKGYQMANLKEPLLHFRFSEQALNRRHGISYLKKEFDFLKSCFQLKLISTYSFSRALVTRLPLRLLPKSVLQLVYTKLLRV
jgi:glycosyltransferase involved in cell wall biosynthesis